MKLIYCIICKSVISLSEQTKACDCGRSSGRYLDLIKAEIAGPCIPIGFANSTFVQALQNQPVHGPGKTFTAFVIEQKCPSIKRSL
jgi:hypothetical protein